MSNVNKTRVQDSERENENFESVETMLMKKQKKLETSLN